jgi:hypothetical protein
MAPTGIRSYEIIPTIVVKQERKKKNSNIALYMHMFGIVPVNAIWFWTVRKIIETLGIIFFGLMSRLISRGASWIHIDNDH